MNEHIGAASQPDDLVGSLAGQDDQPIGEFPELGLVALARLDRAANENASRRGFAAKMRGRASIRIGTPWLGWTMLPMYMIT